VRNGIEVRSTTQKRGEKLTQLFVIANNFICIPLPILMEVEGEEMLGLEGIKGMKMRVCNAQIG
jgi:hypothetical protein